MSNNSVIRHFVAGEDLTGDEGKVVYTDGSDTEKIKVLGSAGDDTAVGILVRGCADDGIAEVCIWGECKALAGGTVEPNDLLVVTTGGLLIASTGSSARRIARYVPPVHKTGGGTISTPDGANGYLIDVFVNIAPDNTAA